MHLHGQHVRAAEECGRIGLTVVVGPPVRARHGGRGQRCRTDRARRHILPGNLRAVEIDHRPGRPQQAHRQIGEPARVGHGEGLPEIGGDVFAARVGTVTDGRGLIAGPIAEDGRTGGPGAVVVARAAPRRAQIGAGVAELPRSAGRDETVSVGGKHRPVIEAVIGCSIAIQCEIAPIAGLQNIVGPFEVQRRVGAEHRSRDGQFQLVPGVMQRHGHRAAPRIAPQITLHRGGAQPVGHGQSRAVHHEIVAQPAVGVVAVGINEQQHPVRRGRGERGGRADVEIHVRPVRAGLGRNQVVAAGLIHIRR